MTDAFIPAYPNPFNAGFGVDPPYVAGRNGIVHRILADLSDGPGRATYITLVVGGRGVGKTVLLNRIRDHVTDEFGWATIKFTAGPDASLAATIDDAYDSTLDALRGRGRRRVAGGSVGVNAGVVRADVALGGVRRRPVTVAAQLRHLGEAAQAGNRQLVLLVDEFQASNPTSLRALSTALQETNGERLPVGLVAAGLPTSTSRLRTIGGVTFLERQRRTNLGNLSPSDTQDALEQPLLAAGRLHDPAIFAPMVAAAAGYPYAIQLIGEKMWDAAGDTATITLDHARQGIAEARDELDSLYQSRWTQLSPAQQDYLRATVSVLRPDGSALSSAVAASLGRSTPQAAKQRDALINQHQLLYTDGQNSIRVALPGLADWVANSTHV